MQSSELKKALVLIVGAVFITTATLPARAAAFDDPKDKQSAASSPDLDAARQQAKQIDDEIIIITKKLPPKEEKPAEGPPSKDKLIMDEARERLEWLKTMQNQTHEAIKQAEQAKNPAEAQVLARDARSKAEAAEHMKQTITGPPPSAQPAASASSNSGSSGSGGFHFSSGALEQLKQSAATSQSAATARDPSAAAQRSQKAFGEGRAGAGGVTMYKAATIVTPLDKSKITGAAVENGRLVLLYDGKKILFPKFDPQFLAIAIRSVYGGESLVKGTLLAEEDNAVILRTGKQQYGDVTWKKEFLPDLPKHLQAGQELALDLGPGVGALDLPEPSYERITYYGPLKGNIMGQVVQESDMVFSTFWNGTDWRTGLPLDLAKVPGYTSAIELDLASTPHVPGERPSVDYLSDDTAVIAWSSNSKINAVVRYGTSPANLDKTAQANARGTVYRATLEKLSPKTTYYFRVESTPGSGGAASLSDAQSFTTAGGWWGGTVWFVWAPNEMSLELAPDGSQFRFVKSSMQVVTWSVRPQNVSDRSKAEAEFLTQHYDEFAQAFPVLQQLREAAKTVSVVRWLKANNVPLDQTWAKGFVLPKVTTLDKVLRYSVYISRDKSGKPEVENPETGNQ